jgi:hypothetical protein
MDDFGASPASQVEQGCQPEPDATRPIDWHVQRSPFGACPLCGLGEAGSEHLCVWCPAVACAWAQLWPDRAVGSLLQAVAVDGPHLATTAALLHQSAFLYGSLQGRATMHWSQAAGWLVRAVRHRGLLHALADISLGADDIDDPDDHGDVEDLAPTACDVWTHAATARCLACRGTAPVGRLLYTTAGHALRAAGPRPDDDLVLTPAAACPLPPGRLAAVFCSDQRRALWPLREHAWVPEPRVVDDRNATAHWDVRRCECCGGWRAALITTAALDVGGEVTVPSQAHVLGRIAARSGVEVAFDGGARLIHGHRVAGAGAVLWDDASDTGGPALVAEAQVALPGETTAPVAEAWGLRLALALLDVWKPRRRVARVIGDNLAVIRYGAAQGRIHRTHLHSILEQPLSRAALTGWQLHWSAVRRRFNRHADRMATEAVLYAGDLALAGRAAPVTRIVWHRSRE